jgi:hypothetical protein
MSVFHDWGRKKKLKGWVFIGWPREQELASLNLEAEIRRIVV